MARLPQATASPGRTCRYQKISHTSALTGGSKSRIYALLAEGELEAVRLAGKTLVKTPSIIAFLDRRAEPWKPDLKRVEKAVGGRPDVAPKAAASAAREVEDAENCLSE